MPEGPKVLMGFNYEELLFKEETREDIEDKGRRQEQEVLEGGKRKKGSGGSMMNEVEWVCWLN